MAVLRFLAGAFVEMCQLLLVLVSALFGTQVAMGRGLHDTTTHEGHNSPALLGFMIVYSALAWLPARDLVEGWLGLVARRLPDRYKERAENVGRGVMALVFSGVFIALFFVLPSDFATKQGEAFERSFALLALSIFGIGGAIPRLWFGLRASAWDPPTAVPQLLREAGKRGAIVIISIFIGIGVAFTTAFILGSR